MYTHMYIYCRRRNSFSGNSLRPKAVTAGKWQKCNLVSGKASVWTWVGYELGGSAPHQCRWAWCCLFAALSWLCVGCSGLGRFFIDLLLLREQSTWSFLGLDSCVLAYCSLKSFYNYARGHCEAAQTSNCSGVYWEERMRDGGISAAGRGYNHRKSLHWRCEMWVDCVERKRSAKLPWSATAPCTFAAAPSFQACLRAFDMYILYVCVHICVCVHVCGHVYLYVYACVYVVVHICVYTHVYVCVYTYLCIDCGSWYQYFSVWTVLCLRMCLRVHMYAYTYVCGYIYMCIFLQWVLHALYRCFGH